jgi:transcriptional regulator with XRE-family HTH domain
LATYKNEMLDAEDGYMEISLLKQERLNRRWSRAQVEAETEIPQRSLENWEEGIAFPREENIRRLCKLYGKSAMQLGLAKSRGIIGVGKNAPTSQEENPIVSDSIRRSALSDLGSYLIGLVSTWPRRNYHYKELQEGINRAVIDHNTLIGQDAISVLNRRQALISLGLVPIQLIGGVATQPTKKTVDTDTLLPHCAAGITACWYLRRGKDLAFVSDLISSYIAILQPLINSHSESYRKASATLLAQSFRLKGALSRSLKNSAGIYYDKAIHYALMSENPIEQAISSNIRAMALHWTKEHEQALLDAENAYGLVTKDTPKIIRSFIAAGLSQCQAASGHPEDAKTSLKEAHDLFDPSTPIPSMPYSEAILTFVSANVKQHSGHWQESTNLYKKCLSIPDISALGSIQGRINYVKTEVSRDDRPRDMRLCITLLTEAIRGAKELGSERYKREARETFDLLRIAWPREDAIKTLGKDHFGIK